MHPHSICIIKNWIIINLFLSIMRMEIFYIVISLLYFNPLQVSHSFNEVWFVLLFIVGLYC